MRRRSATVNKLTTVGGFQTDDAISIKSIKYTLSQATKGLIDSTDDGDDQVKPFGMWMKKVKK